VAALLYALFLASGFAALLYQVVWQRLLTLVTGLDLAAVATIVAAFMLGMGLGSLAGGQWADRLRPRRLLAGFALAELVIAAFAALSPWLYGDLFRVHLVPVLDNRDLLLVAGLTLCLPTFCMGLTLPMLARALTPRLDLAARSIAGLYGWNTLGAAAGAGIGTGVVIRAVGYEQAVQAGVALNLVAAALSLWLMTRLPAKPATNPAPHRHPLPPISKGPWPFGAWLALYFVSGFVSLGLEVVWFRLLGVLLKSTAFTFPYLLSLFLAGVGAGSLAGRAWAARHPDPARLFLLLQTAIPVYAVLSTAALTWLLADAELVAAQRLRDYLGGTDPIPFQFDFVALSPAQAALYLLIPAILVLPPTLLMGLSFPVLQSASQRDFDRLGRRVGRLQAANILGGVLGSLVVGVVLLDQAGTAGALRVLGLLGAIFPLFLAWRKANRSGWVAAPLVVPMVLLLVPDGGRLWSALHGTVPSRIIPGEDATGLSVLRSKSVDFTTGVTVFANGLGQSNIPFTRGNTALGAVPVLLHPDPRDIAVIGIGGGATLFALTSRPETRSVDSIEIIGTQLDTLRALYERTGYGGLQAILDDPRIRYITGDGRGYLLRNGRQYDLIQADALRPTSAYAGNLYSLEYFTLLRRQLKPGGLAATWSPTPRTERTFRRAFPHVLHLPSLLIGSNRPIEFDVNRIQARARSASVRAHFQRAGIDIEGWVAGLFAGDAGGLHPAGTGAASDINTDLFPRDELGL
jgi:predicted membrane-bound spermidine synthase